MGFLDFLNRKETPIERVKSGDPVVDDAFNDGKWDIYEAPGLGVAPSRQMNRLLKEFVSWVAANVRAIAQPVSEMEFQLKKVLPNGDIEDVTTHPFLDLLYRPNPNMVRSDFLKLCVSYYLLAGESPIRLRRNNPDNMKETPFEMWPVSPGLVTVMVGKKDSFDILTGYKIGSGNDETKLMPWEMVFPTNPNPNNSWRGMGVVEQAQSTIDTIDFSEAFNLAFFKNSGIPPVVLYTDQKLDATIMARLRENWNSNHRGVGNAYKTAILEAGLKIQELQGNHKDMDFLEQQRFMRDKLMAMFGNTKGALGIVEDVNRANAEASEYIHMKNVVKPMMRVLCEYFNEYLLPVFDPKGELFLTFKDPVPENGELKLQEDIAACDKWETKNEIRERRGLPAIEGGDIIYQPISLQPMGTEIPSIGAPADATPGKMYLALKAPDKSVRAKLRYAEDVQRLSNRNIKRKELKDKLTRTIKKELLAIRATGQVKTKKYLNVHKKSTIDLYVKSVLSIMKRHEVKIFNGAGAVYKSQEKEILRKLSNAGKSISKKALADTFMFDKEPQVKAGIDLMTPLIEALLLDQGDEAMLLLGLSKPYSVMEAARAYLIEAPRKSIKSMTDTAYDRVRASIADGLANGESMLQLKARVRDEYAKLTEAQARAIAATESARGSNFAQIDAYKQSGVVSGKRWEIAGDACEFCLAAMDQFNAVGTDLDSNFYNKGDSLIGVDGGVLEISYDDVDAPPLHVHCKCVTLPVVEEIRKAPDAKIKIVERVLDPTDDQILDAVEKELAKIK